jgi:hypothetical protein
MAEQQWKLRLDDTNLMLALEHGTFSVRRSVRAWHKPL